jgi:Tfp pilus assembly PilM family ATPase
LTNLRRTRGEFEPRNLGVLRLPAGLVKPHFTDLNITDEAQFAERLREVALQADLRRVRKLAVSLPAGSARSLVFQLETLPDDKQELAQMIEWKIERTVGTSATDCRISYDRLSDFEGRSQWLATVVHHRVSEQYDGIFRQLGWQAGLVLPQALGEAQWLLRNEIAEDQALVSMHPTGFDAVFVRQGEPILVREVTCAPEECEDEFFRLLVFYRDRLTPAGSAAALARLLTLGSAGEQRRLRDVVNAALEHSAVSLDASQIGLRVEPQAPFREMAGATGLATMAWS